MSSLEQQRALRRSALWIAHRRDFRYATDRELLKIIEQQPVHFWHGSGRAIAARWEAQRRGLLVATDPLPGDDPRRTQPVPPPEPAPLPASRVQRTEADALLASLILNDPLADTLLTSLILNDPL